MLPYSPYSSYSAESAYCYSVTSPNPSAELTRIHPPFPYYSSPMESFFKCKDSISNIIDNELNAFNQAVREELILREFAPLLSCT